MKKKVEIRINGDEFLIHLRNVCKKVIEEVYVSNEDYTSACILFYAISKALELSDKEDNENA